MFDNAEMHQHPEFIYFEAQILRFLEFSSSITVSAAIRGLPRGAGKGFYFLSYYINMTIYHWIACKPTFQRKKSWYEHVLHKKRRISRRYRYSLSVL